MGALSFNEMEIDALGEMMNISLGASATAMSTLWDLPFTSRLQG
ncbi:MAG: chemotaxis protein CheC [Pilosibacter sp.]